MAILNSSMCNKSIRDFRLWPRTHSSNGWVPLHVWEKSFNHTHSKCKVKHAGMSKSFVPYRRPSMPVASIASQDHKKYYRPAILVCLYH